MGDARAERDLAERAKSREAPPTPTLRPRSYGIRLGDAIVQPKLAVGPANDPLEHEADAVAERVVRSLRQPPPSDAAGRVQRGAIVAGPGGEVPGEADRVVRSVRRSSELTMNRDGSEQRVRRSAQSSSSVSRATGVRVQRAATIGESGGELDRSTSDSVQSARGGGRAMPTETRAAMEGAFGADFGSVRVHDGPAAASLNDQISARAFTVGNDVFFRDGLPDVGSADGARLLAHELTHTVQQGAATLHGATADGDVQRAIDPSAVSVVGESVQRWDLRSAKVPIEKTTKIATVNPARPVFFLTDGTGDKIVVKGEDTPIGQSRLVAEMHEGITGTPTVFTIDVTGRKQQLLSMLTPKLANDKSWDELGNDTMSAGASGQAKWFGMTPEQWLALPAAERARKYQGASIENLPKLHAMAWANGESAETLSTPGKAMGGATGVQSMRTLVSDPKYMQKLGEISAVDFFTENGDRLLSNNFGNWFTDSKGGITLIDNLNDDAKDLWKRDSTDVLPKDLITMLSAAKLAATAQTLAEKTTKGLKSFGDDTAEEYMKGRYKGATREAEAAYNLLIGLERAKAALIKRYATAKMGSKGRQMKKHAERSQKADQTREGADIKVDYWEVLKARGRYLKAN